MTGIILYQSKYGATKKYADWLSEETGFPCVETKKARIDEVSKYDVIVLGGGIYASGIAGLSFLKKHIDALKGKKIIVFCDGASPYEEKAFGELVSRNMTGSLEGIPCFYCRGAWDPNGMNAVDKTMCKMLLKAVTKKDPADCEVWEKALLEAGDSKCDWTDRKYLEPIIKAIYG